MVTQYYHTTWFGNQKGKDESDCRYNYYLIDWINKITVHPDFRNPHNIKSIIKYIDLNNVDQCTVLQGEEWPVLVLREEGKDGGHFLGIEN